MPIGDLLASITGEKPASSTAAGPKVTISGAKRKADDDISQSASKTLRTGSSSSEPSRSHDRPTIGSNGGSGLRRESALSSGQCLTSSSAQGRDSSTPSSRYQGATAPANGSKATSTTLPVRTTRPGSTSGAGQQNEPKKLSQFAQVMARAAAAKETLAGFGKIQHKTIERGLSMKERKEMRAAEAKQKKKPPRPSPGAGAGSSVAAQTAGKSLTAVSKAGASGGKGASSTASFVRPKGKDNTVIEEKRVKKAALATTGYTGTARPRPGAPSTKPSSSAPSSNTQARPQHSQSRYGGALSRPRRYDEDDEEDMDGFIDYDEDEDPAPGPNRYRYASEDDSDMEAGISDIDQEERRAEVVARREDLEEEAREKRLKREKEERKQKHLAAIKAKAGTR